MRKSILLLMSVALAITSSAQSSVNKEFKNSQIQAKVKEFKTDNKSYVRKYVLQREQELPSIIRPAQEEEWLYEDEWIKEGDYFYKYDNQGNITRNLYDDGFSATATDYTYDENGNRTSIIETYSEEGAEFENSSKRTLSYDSKVTNVVTESQSYAWDEELSDWTLASDGRTYRRIINRNDIGNVTGVEIHNYFMGEYLLQMRSTIAYNEEGLATEWTYEELSYNEENELAMQEVYSFKEMQWQTTDGQILVLDDPSDFFTGKLNRLQSAKVYEYGEEAYDVEATYNEDGSYSYKLIYDGGQSAETMVYTVTDANGSYTVEEALYEDMDMDGELTDADLLISALMTVTLDQYGRVIEEVAEEDEELMYAAKYDFTYTEECGDYPVEQIFYEYDFDELDYVPFLKITGKDFSDVSTEIKTLISDSESVKEIFTLNGIRINANKDTLPAGIYIIRQGNKASKIVITK